MTRLTLAYHLRAIRDGVPDDAYDTGHPFDGRVCDAYDVDAHAALRSGDPVAYLDAVAHDPACAAQTRHDAAALLTWHVNGVPLDEPDHGIQLPVRSWSPAACPTCGSEEALFDVTRPDDPCRCVGCDVPIPRPTYP